MTLAFPVPAAAVPPSLAPMPSPLAPLIAGARARGVADAFEWLGIAAILLDEQGEALHVNAGAKQLLGESLYLEHGRLRAHNPLVDASLSAAIGEVVETGASARLTISDGRLEAHIGALDTSDEDHYQLLRAIVILEPGLVAS
jgi:hypothetical protein